MLTKLTNHYHHWFDTGLLITITSAGLAIDGRTVSFANDFKLKPIGMTILELNLLLWIITWIFSIVLVMHYHQHTKKVRNFGMYVDNHKGFKWMVQLFTVLFVISIGLLVVSPFSMLF